MPNKVIKPCKSYVLISISCLWYCNHLASCQIIVNPVCHYLFSSADNDPWWWEASISTNSFNDRQRLAIFRTSSVELLVFGWYNDDLSSWATNSDTRFVHIQDVFGSINTVFRKGILVLNKEVLEIFFAIGSNPYLGNWLGLNCMQTWVSFKPFLEPGVWWRIMFLLLAKIANCSIDNGWSSSQSHFQLVLAEPQYSLLLCLCKDSIVTTMLVNIAKRVSLLMALSQLTHPNWEGVYIEHLSYSISHFTWLL